MMEETNQNNQEELKDVEVTEFSLTAEEIDELVTKLQLLKENKEPFGFDIDDENELVVSFEEGV